MKTGGKMVKVTVVLIIIGMLGIALMNGVKRNFWKLAEESETSRQEQLEYLGE